jgi:hypothetical protein
METGNINCTIFIQGIIMIGARRAVKSHRKAPHELTTQKVNMVGCISVLQLHYCRFVLSWHATCVGKNLQCQLEISSCFLSYLEGWNRDEIKPTSQAIYFLPNLDIFKTNQMIYASHVLMCRCQQICLHAFLWALLDTTYNVFLNSLGAMHVKMHNLKTILSLITRPCHWFESVSTWNYPNEFTFLHA